MARPKKYTVDYFSHDSNASEGKTLTILFNNFGHDGISCWWQLLERVSSTNNHVISIINSEELEYLAAKLRFQPDRLKSILDKLSSLKAIDQELYENGYIWIQNLVDRLETVYKTRRQELPLKPELHNNIQYQSNTQNLHKIKSHSNNELIQEETELIQEETELMLPISTQTKETKLNYTKDIYSHWNGKNIITHKKMTDDIKRVIDKKLNDYTIEEIKQTIDNYDFILNSDEYFFKYKWTLKDFMNRGFEKFIDLEISKNNFIKNRGNGNGQSNKSGSIPGNRPAGAFSDLD